MEGGERGEMDGMVGIDGEGLVGECTEADMYCLVDRQRGLACPLDAGKEE